MRRREHDQRQRDAVWDGPQSGSGEPRVQFHVSDDQRRHQAGGQQHQLDPLRPGDRRRGAVHDCDRQRPDAVVQGCERGQHVRPGELRFRRGRKVRIRCDLRRRRAEHLRRDGRWL